MQMHTQTLLLGLFYLKKQKLLESEYLLHAFVGEPLNNSTRVKHTHPGLLFVARAEPLTAD